MEIFLITLLAIVLFIEHGGTLREKVISVAINNPYGAIKYLGSGALLILIISFLPTLFLSIYMRQNGFFAFELFGEQRLAVQVLSANAFLNYLLVGFFLSFGFLIWSNTKNWFSRISAILVSLFTFGVVIWVAYVSGKFELAITILSFCIVIGVYIVFWLGTSPSKKAKYWWIPLFISGLILFSPIIYGSNTAMIVENALQQMKVGGIDIEYYEPLQPNNNAHKARLLLRTPTFYYVRNDEEHGTSPKMNTLILPAEQIAIRYMSK